MSNAHPILDHPGHAAHNDRYMRLATGKFNWQIIAGLALSTAMILTLALVYQSGQRKEYAFVVQLDTQGEARYIKELSAENVHTPFIVQAIVAQFIRNVRTITTDQTLFLTQLNTGYASCLRDAQEYIRTSYETTKPFDLIAKGVAIYPQHIEVSSLSLTEYKLHWTEQTIEHGQVVEDKRWEGMVRVELVAPSDLTTEQRKQNPLGIYINYVNFFSY